LEKLRYSVEKKKIKDVLLTGKDKKSFVKTLDDRKFKVSGLILPARVQWEALIKHPIKDYAGNLITLEDCFDKSKPKPEQVEIDDQISYHLMF
jgi:hypothetical protein